MIFYKTSSFGNDFIEIDAKELAGPKGRRPLGEVAREICDRQRGVGADGVVYYRACRQAARPGESSLKRLSSSPGAAREQQIEFQIFNRDGGEAELSGNGMAGLAAVLFQRRLAASPLTLQAGIGSRHVELLGRDGALFHLKVEIGKPDFVQRGFFPFLGKTREPYRCAGVVFHPVSVGNPHAVVVYRKMPAAAQLAVLGEKLESHPMFPKRVNVEFVQCTGAESCRVFFYERGVGPTLASSTGSAAVFAVLRRLGMAGDRLGIDLGAERIQLSWNDGIFIRNTTRLICRGEFFL